MILTRRQDDILLINYLSHTPSHSFLLELLEMNGLSTDLTLINVVSTISKTGLSLFYDYYRLTRSITK